MPTYPPEMEGKTATSKDGKQRIVIRNGEAVVDTTYKPPVQRTKPSSTDHKALQEAQARASSERDGYREYSHAEKAIKDMGTGPVKARFLDTIVPDEDGGFLDGLGAVIGSPARWLTPQKTLTARDHLRTVNSGVALEGSSQMKGSSSDKDTALMRMAGVSPYKSEAENLRIIREARIQSRKAQLRAELTANWISRFGSLTAPGKGGMTFNKYLTIAEDDYDKRVKAITSGKRLPPAPKRGRKSGPVTIDINGNEI